ncbi:MAG: bifunctional diaminohydroxyphosphoribosylaminopyrimidine deaminase/5-amino-6-(5-phosphoribosylamino)uracil reductase RibD [Ahrensia sp.]|nr:bifunctional diaminohydroxyphosphoribosylaminopyrimidine deaminase/5-amino-6-(5-phosphoribosylamino)uracil reductase RibD [Ahrensia sp.]
MPDDVLDTKLLEACLRLARRHQGLTAANPSVGTLLVQFDDHVPIIVGRGITAFGGRPHAERVAIDEAGEKARGATAYVTLEPCAHHGATPPCAQALIDAGVARVVTAWTDPDQRVNGKGHAMLLEAGIELSQARMEVVRRDLSAYLTRKSHNRPHVTLKLAVSADGKLGVAGKEVPVTGVLARSVVHRMRAQADAIAVGSGTLAADDPDLTCRLPGLETRSPRRFVLDGQASMAPTSRLARTAMQVPTTLVTAQPVLPEALTELGVTRLAAELHDGRIALPEMLEDMAADGVSSLMVEGGAAVAQSFLASSLVDSLALFTAPTVIGKEGLASPVCLDTVPNEFRLERSLTLGHDQLDLFFKV